MTFDKLRFTQLLAHCVWSKVTLYLAVPSRTTPSVEGPSNGKVSHGKYHNQVLN